MNQRLIISSIIALVMVLWATDTSVIPQNNGAIIAPIKILPEAITIPRMLSYQGRLTDSLGNPVPDDNYQMTFRFYPQENGGSPFWTETQTVYVSSGLFSVLLGAVTPIASIPEAGSIWLSLQVSSEPELSPRLRIVSSAYSYLSERSANADSAVGSERIGGYNIAGLDTRYVNENQANSVNSGMIVDGTIVGADMNQMGAGAGQVLKWSGSIWAPADDNVGTGDNAWVRGTPDSVLYTIRQLGIARGGGNNMLYGSQRYTHINLGVYSKTGTNGQNYGYCTVNGGYDNTASGAYTTVGGGVQNIASGTYAMVGGGWLNNASGWSATVGGGFADSAAGAYAGVFSGWMNKAGDVAIDTGAVIAGGYYNRATAKYAIIGGGFNNTASNWFATICGGRNNTVSGDRATVGGGGYNIASGGMATVAGGSQNIASGDYATIGGGYKDTALAIYSGVFSGFYNKAGDDAADTGAVVSGGCYNYALAKYATVGGGCNDSAFGNYATLCGGRNNKAFDSYATVGGGYSNIAENIYATVSGGYQNRALLAGTTVSGGSQNVASNSYATISGGANNNASGAYTAVGGGQLNTASGTNATVGGGYQNTASNIRATVGGGAGNTASGSHSTVGGGSQNIASGDYATVGGGVMDTVAGFYGFAVGYRSIVPSGYSNSAAFNGTTATSSNQLRCGTLSKVGGTFTIDHPVDPYNKILNHYFVESPEMINIYRGSVVLNANGKAEVKLPEYFSALNRNAHIQLTGVGTSDVYVAEDIKGNSFVIGGKPGTKVYWQVTGERADVSAEAIRRMMPVEQPKTGALSGRMLDDEFLSGCMEQLEHEGKASGINFRTPEGRRRYQQMKNLQELER